MDFYKYKCPVCEKQFTKNDDIVVCPECGAPHHRECYEKEEHCFFEDKHLEGFVFEQNFNNEGSESSESSDGTVICKNCNTENPKETFYCYKCGAPLNEQDMKAENRGQNQQNGIPFGMPFGQAPFGQAQMVNPFDPMAGLDKDEAIAENVTAGEMAKFVGKSTPYFLRIFNNIKKFGSSRFNFSAFVFSGMYFLYRKMIALGCIFSFILIGVTVAEAYIQMLPAYQDAYLAVMNALNSGQYVSLMNIPGVSQQETFFALLPGILEFIKLAMMIVCGAIANRRYYKHCTKKINSIKQNADDNVSKILESQGGVNLPLAVCIGIAYIIVTYIPTFIYYF